MVSDEEEGGEAGATEEIDSSCLGFPPNIQPAMTTKTISTISKMIMSNHFPLKILIGGILRNDPD